MKVYNGNMLKNIDCAYIEECIRNDLDVTWASVEIKGSMVNVYIKENYSMNKEAVKSVYSDGEDIVSSCQGVVKKIITRSGTPLVACGDEVQEGQVLVLLLNNTLTTAYYPSPSLIHRLHCFLIS